MDERSDGDGGDGAGPETGASLGIDLAAFTRGVLEDLEKLRAGEISVPDARARARLQDRYLRAVGLLFQGQKLLAQRAKAIEAPKEGEG